MGYKYGEQGTLFLDKWGDLRGIRFILVCFATVLLVLGTIAGLVIGITYAAQGCLIYKAHLSPHISDGIYEARITEVVNDPNSDDHLIRMAVEINGKTYGMSSCNEPLCELIKSQGNTGYLTLWIKNNHVIKHHKGHKRDNEPK